MQLEKYELELLWEMDLFRERDREILLKATRMLSGKNVLDGRRGRKVLVSHQLYAKLSPFILLGDDTEGIVGSMTSEMIFA